ncbi:MAG: hypothetical protein ACJ72R_05620 [Nitrososphaeraceae archaeon]|jgi:hypothetical protein
MHIPIHIKIVCKQENIQRVKEFLSPNKLIHIVEFHDVKTPDKDIATLDISGVVFDDEDIPLLESNLKHYGQVRVNRGQVRILTLNTILSALIVAGIVSVALLAHGLNEDFYKEVFEHHNTRVVLETALTIGSSSVAGFLLELLVVYREKRITHR